MDCYSVINNTRTIEKSILYKLSWYILFSFEYHNIYCSNPFCFNRRKRSILKEFKIELYNFLNLYFWYLSYNIKNTINGPQNFCFLKFNFVYELVCFFKFEFDLWFGIHLVYAGIPKWSKYLTVTEHIWSEFTDFGICAVYKKTSGIWTDIWLFQLYQWYVQYQRLEEMTFIDWYTTGYGMMV